MNKLKILIILLLFQQLCFALNPFQEPVNSIVLKGMELTINNRYDEAAHLYQQLIDQYPYHPIGYFYKGTVYHAKMLDIENYDLIEEFYPLMDLVITLSDSLRKEDWEDSWLYFYEGSAYLYRSFIKSKTGSWFSAYRDARKGANLLEKAITIDSMLYDAYLGIGSFKYWKSARANFLLWLPFISDEREQGISLLYTAIEKGKFVKSVGRDQLCWILMNSGNYKKAFQLAEENAKLYPHSRFYKWTLAYAAFYSDQYELSYQLYDELFNEVQQLPENNHFNEIDCLVKMAEIMKKSEKWKESFHLADQALNIKLEDHVRKRAKNKLKRALEIRQEIELILMKSDS